MPWQLGVLLFLLAEKRFQVFNPAEDEDYERPDGADDKHAFEKSRQNDDENVTHKQTMLFQIKEIDQRHRMLTVPKDCVSLRAACGRRHLCYADLCDESLPKPGVWSSYQRRCRSSSSLS
jgi:hypothetical protein